MAYALDEKNNERQQLLGKILNPLTIPALRLAAAIPGGRRLVLACGQGNTTTMLAEELEPAECIGLDFDPRHVENPGSQKNYPPCVRFQQGNALQLDFPDATFDVVFTRYKLAHMPDAAAVVGEMKRWIRSRIPSCQKRRQLVGKKQRQSREWSKITTPGNRNVA